MGGTASKRGTSTRGAGRGTSRPRSFSIASKPPQQAAPGPAGAACGSIFRFVVVALVAMTFLGLARVGLAAKVAEASIDATKLERTIKTESMVSDRLELDRSLLVTPSRIESEAAGLDMTKAPTLRFIAVPAGTAALSGAPKVPKPPARALVSSRVQGTSGMLTAALEVTQREARALLVGDVGVAVSP